MEKAILDTVNRGVKAVGLPGAVDLRGKLKTNPRAKKWKTRDVNALKGLVWHQELGWGSVESVADYHTGKDSHLAKGGVATISYTWAVRRNGQLVLCNDFDQAVWSQGYAGRPGDENAEFMSLMFEGFFKGPGVTDPSAGEPNDEQLLAALILWRTCREQWSWDAGDLYGHFQFGKPACPGTSLETVITAIRANDRKATHDLATAAGRQGALQALGFYHGAIDGVWGPRSRGALVAFQVKHDLPGDGVWGPTTAAAIVGALAD